MTLARLRRLRSRTPAHSLLLVCLLACGGGSEKPSLDAGAQWSPHDDGGSSADSAVSTPGSDASAQQPPGDGGTHVDPTLTCDPEHEVLWPQTGHSADGKVSYVLNRCAFNACAGGCGIGEVYFSLTYLGRTDAAKGAQVQYTRTHHNWNDALTATLPDRLLKWWVVLDENDPELDWTMQVSVEARDGAIILAPTEVGIDGDEWHMGG